MGDGTGVLSLSPKADCSGRDGQAGKAVGIVHPDVGVIGQPDGLGLEVHVDHRGHNERDGWTSLDRQTRYF